MDLRIPTLVSVIGILCGTGATYGQSLADVARKEADRRKAVRDGGKVYTNKDLPSVPPPATPAASPSSPDAAPEKGADAQPDAKVSPPDAAEKKDQAYWGKRMKDLLAQLDRDQTYAEALQTRVNALTADFVNRDDPVQRAQLGINRQKALSELDRLKKQIGGEKHALADLEEEARRSGVPPGWLR